MANLINQLSQASKNKVTKTSAAITQGVVIIHVNDVQANDGVFPYSYVSGLVGTVPGQGTARINSMGGICYKPSIGEDLICISMNGILYVVGSVVKDTGIFEQMNNGDLLLNPPGDLIINPGGEVIGVLDDYYPMTNGTSFRAGYKRDTYTTITSGEGYIELSTTPTVSGDSFYPLKDSNVYICNLIIGCANYEDGDSISMWINVGDVDEKQVICNSYLNSVPELIEFKKPILLTEGKKIRVRYYTSATKNIWISFDCIY